MDIEKTLKVKQLADLEGEKEANMGEVEQLLGEYLAIDGEQKVYVLPKDLNVDQLLGSLSGIRTGEIKQSQMWRKTDITIDTTEQSKKMAEMSIYFQAMEKRIEQLEFLLHQVSKQDEKAKEEEVR